MFAKTIDGARQRLCVDPNSKEGRAGIGTDGGDTQLKCFLSEESLKARDERNETAWKLCTNTSGTSQPCDVGNVHCNTRINMRLLSSQPVPTLNVGYAFDSAMSEMTDRGMINFDSAALSEIRGIVCRIPRALRSPCSEKEVINSFVQAGWTDRETLQAPDLKVL